MRRMESDVTGRSRCVWVRMVTAMIRQLELELIQTPKPFSEIATKRLTKGRPFY